MAARKPNQTTADDLNIVKREGPPSRRIASPMMEPYSPIQRGTFDTATNLPEPTDSLGFLTDRGAGAGTKKPRR